MFDEALGKQSIVFDLRLAKRGCVVGQDNQLCFARSKSLESALITEAVLLLSEIINFMTEPCHSS